MKTTKRTRLAPEERRSQLLDVAQSLVLEHGLNSFTMEALTNAAGVSKPLVYKYFDTRLELLQTLLLREFQRFNDHQREEVDKANDYREIVTFMVTVNFDEFSKGNIIRILRGQSDVNAALQAIEQKVSKKLAKFLVDRLMSEYDFPRKQAEHLTVMSSGASVAAAEYFSRFGGHREQQIEDTVTYIFGGIESSFKKQNLQP